MPKKKRRKNSGNFFGGIGKAFGLTFKLILKVIPLALVVTAGGGIFLGIKQALYADSSLNVQKINVSPAQALSENQHQRLQTEVYGKNILKVDINGLSRSLEKDPGIQNVKISRRFPSEIGVEVTKRNPVAYLQLSARGRFAIISSDGMILDVVEEARATGLRIEAYSLGITQPVLGHQIKNRGLYEAVQFLQAYERQPMLRNEPVTKMVLDALGNVSIILGEGPEVRLGRRPMQRLESLKKIGPFLESEMRKKIEYLDLQYDDVVVKQKKGVK